MATINYPFSIGYHRREGGTGANGVVKLAPSDGLSVKKGDPLVLADGEAELISAVDDKIWGIAAHDYPLTVVPDEVDQLLAIPADRNNVFHIETAGSTNFTQAMIGTTRNFLGTTSGEIKLNIGASGTLFLIEGLMPGYEFGTSGVRVYGRFVSTQYLAD